MKNTASRKNEILSVLKKIYNNNKIHKIKFITIKFTYRKLISDYLKENVIKLPFLNNVNLLILK